MLSKGMYLGLAYGIGMYPGTDYVAFRGTGQKGVVEDLIEGPGYGYSGPINDTSARVIMRVPSFDYEVTYSKLQST